MTSKELCSKIVNILDKKKAMDIQVIGISNLTIIADYFVLATGTSTTQVKALADEVEFQLKQQDVVPSHTEGYSSSSWILSDYGNVVLHVFTKDARDFYSLERLWADGESVDISTMIETDKED